MTGKKVEQEVVDKGFNDDELADIMNEIENLESDFEAESHDSHDKDIEIVDELLKEEDEPVQEHDPVEEVYKEDTPAVKEVVHQLSKKPVEEYVKPKPAPVHHIHPTPEHKEWSPSGAQTSMSFKVEGDMKLSMSFWVSGKEFKVWVDEAQGFTIELDGGAQFKVPIAHTPKKVA